MKQWCIRLTTLNMDVRASGPTYITYWNDKPAKVCFVSNGPHVALYNDINDAHSTANTFRHIPSLWIDVCVEEAKQS